MEVGNLKLKITLLKYNNTKWGEGKLQVAHPCSRIMVIVLYFFSEATIKSVRIELKQFLSQSRKGKLPEELFGSVVERYNTLILH